METHFNFVVYKQKCDQLFVGRLLHLGKSFWKFYVVPSHFPISQYISITNDLVHKGIYWCIMTQICCIPFSKPFFCIIRLIITQTFAFMCLLGIFSYFSWDSRKSLWRTFWTLSINSTTLSMTMILMGSDLIWRCRRVYRIFLLA